MPRNQSEIPTAPPPEPKPIPCSPSAWWVKCQDCGACETTGLYMVQHLLCLDCGGTVDPLDNGAVWGFEWATVVFMRNLQRDFVNLDAEFDEYVDNNSQEL